MLKKRNFYFFNEFFFFWMNGPGLFSRKDRVEGTFSGSSEGIEPNKVFDKRHYHSQGRKYNNISSPVSALEIPLSSTLGLTPLRGDALIGEGCRSTPSIIGRDSNLLPVSFGVIKVKEENAAMVSIRASVWFINGRGRSYNDDDFFSRMAKITQAVMPLLLNTSNISSFNTFSTSSLSRATERLKLEKHSNELSDSSNGNKNQPEAHFQRKRYSREFELFICNILKKTGLSSIVLLLALKYIHRLRLAYPGVAPTTGAEYRLFSVAMILANKYLEDRTFTNKTWASLTAMPITEVNIMEREFLTILDFDLCINEIEFSNWISAIEGFLEAIGVPPEPLGGKHLASITAIE